MKGHFYHCKIFSSCLVNFFVLKSTLSGIFITTPNFSWLGFSWYNFFHPLTFTFSVSSYLRYISYEQYTVIVFKSRLEIFDFNWAFAPFTLRVILDILGLKLLFHYLFYICFLCLLFNCAFLPSFKYSSTFLLFHFPPSIKFSLIYYFIILVVTLEIAICMLGLLKST